MRVEIDSLTIGQIDYGYIARTFDSGCAFPGEAEWDTHFDCVLRGLSSVRKEIIKAARALAAERKTDARIGDDAPTDLIQAISITLVLRTMGMLVSKSRDHNRTQINRDAHGELAQRYQRVLDQVEEGREAAAALFPYEEGTGTA